MVNYCSNPKKIFYISICLISLISGMIFLLTIKSNNRKFNQNLLVNANTLYINYLKELNKETFENFDLNASEKEIPKDVFLILKELAGIYQIKSYIGHKYLFPFKLIIVNKKIEKTTKFSLDISNDNSHGIQILTIFIDIFSIKKEEMNLVFNILSKFAVYEKLEDKTKQTNISVSGNNNSINNPISYNYYPIVNHINIYKHINLFILTNPKDSKTNNEKIVKYFKSNFERLGTFSNLNLYIKNLYFKSDKGKKESDLKNDILYKQLKEINSKQVFEELNDENSISIIINDDPSGESLEIYYNKDINKEIYSFDFENLEKSSNFHRILEKLILINNLNREIKDLISGYPHVDLLFKIMNLNNTPSVNFAKLFVTSLDNLEKVNKIFGLYESIRTIEKIKDKVI